MEPTFEWRGAFVDAELNALHAEAFGTRVRADDGRAQVNGHTLIALA